MGLYHILMHQQDTGLDLIEAAMQISRCLMEGTCGKNLPPIGTTHQILGILGGATPPPVMTPIFIWSPAPTRMSTLWFGIKIQPSYRIWFLFFHFFVSHPVFFCIIWPIFGYPKPNMKFFWSNLEPATEFHNLAVGWAQNLPLFMCFEAICDFFPLLRSQKSGFWGFFYFFTAIA